MGVPTEEELKIALKEAARMRELGKDPHHMAKALLNHHYRIELLGKVVKAAELYIRSGNAGHEHTMLVRAIEAAKQSKSNSTDDNEFDFGL